MKISKVSGGDIRQRRSFRVLAPIIFLGFCAAGGLVAVDGFAKQEGGTIRGSALVLGAGALCVRIVRSRIHLKTHSLVIVNPIFWFELPYGEIYRAEMNSGGSLVVRAKGRVNPDEDALSVGFAGSLLDLYFKTTERVVREINKKKKRAPRVTAATKERGVALDVFADFQVVCAFILVLASLFL